MEEKDIRFELTSNMMQQLKAYSLLLDKSYSQIIQEALERYFIQEQERLRIQEERDMTRFDFDEFYDGLDLG